MEGGKRGSFSDWRTFWLLWHSGADCVQRATCRCGRLGFYKLDLEQGRPWSSLRLNGEVSDPQSKWSPKSRPRGNRSKVCFSLVSKLYSLILCHGWENQCFGSFVAFESISWLVLQCHRGAGPNRSWSQVLSGEVGLYCLLTTRIMVVLFVKWLLSGVSKSRAQSCPWGRRSRERRHI